LLLEVIGSRRPILFVEGERSSLDYFIYGKLFPEFTIAPCGSCEAVIHSTRSFSQLAGLHHNTCCGLVDNDGRLDEDIRLLKGYNVAVLPVALVENLFLTEPVLGIAAARLGHNPPEVIAKAKERVFARFDQDAVHVVSNLYRREIESKLRVFGSGADGLEALSVAFTKAFAAVEPAVIYARWEAEIKRVLAERDYAAALRYYKTKGLWAEVGAVLGVRYQDQVMRWLRSKDSEGLVAALRSALPAIPTPAS
jgi:hypothetical protein